MNEHEPRPEVVTVELSPDELSILRVALATLEDRTTFDQNRDEDRAEEARIKSLLEKLRQLSQP
jgi:hypothetical protein